MASMRRFHQLTGPGNKKNIFAFGSSIQYYFTDIPIKSQICGKKYVAAVEGVKLSYDLQLSTLGAPILLTRDDINNILVAQLQVDGSLLGTLVSAAHNKPGILDTVDAICNGGHMEAEVYPSQVVVSGVPTTIHHEIYIPFGYYGCKSPQSMAPMATWIKPANLKIDAPSSLDPSYGLAPMVPANPGDPVGITGTVTASAYILWRDEIVLPPGFQMTRFKSTAANSAAPNTTSDTIDLKSFGQNSTLTGVEQRAAIAALLWGSSDVSGDGKGAGPVNSITDMSALFAGIEQTNDIGPVIRELTDEYRREFPLMFLPFVVQGNPVILPTERRYPLWCAEKDLGVAVGGDPIFQYPSPRPRFLPIFPPRKGGHISKMPIADGSPSYQLTGTFGPQSGNDPQGRAYLSGTGDHYSYMFGLYAWQMPQAKALIQALAADDIGRFLYPSAADANDLQPVLKLHRKNPTAINFSKASFLPEKLLPASIIAAQSASAATAAAVATSVK